MRVHVIGGGLAGLAAAVALSAKGIAVTVSEAAAQAGGRCRSYHDPALGMVIDNGNHLILSGNRATMGYLRTIGAGDRLAGPAEADFAFSELPGGKSWRLKPNAGRLPWWLLSAARRVPDTSPLDYLALTRLMRATPGQRIGDVIDCDGVLWKRLLHPLLLAALNTEPETASATLAGSIIRETLAMGGEACMPRIADPTLAAAFVDPAIAFIQSKGGDVHLGRRLRTIQFDGDRVASLSFANGEEKLAADDRIILAVPPWVAQSLLPGLDAPDEFHAIVNAHYAITAPVHTPMMTGAVGALPEWIFAFDDRISITISCADRVVERDREELARAIWRDVAALLGMKDDLPRWQIVKEKRATFAATPAQNAKRPQAKSRWSNLFLAGDWTDTGLPATIEGAIRSGDHAAKLALAAPRR